MHDSRYDRVDGAESAEAENGRVGGIEGGRHVKASRALPGADCDEDARPGEHVQLGHSRLRASGDRLEHPQYDEQLLVEPLHLGLLASASDVVADQRMQLT
ncbi:MAG: hypothetical protein QOH55_2033 [Microbacteriaceae bacterium]|nr:hypothetical protein [Microbacteriaceae bacterium]